MNIKELVTKENWQSLDKKTIIICITAAVCLTMNRYLPEMDSFVPYFNNGRISQLANWAFIHLVFYLVVPIFIIKVLFRENVADYGLKWCGAFKSYWIYLVMLVMMIPLVAYFSTTTSFQETYPFYKLAPDEKLYPNFWIWEALYFLQFVGLEFFFRGFMVLGLKNRFGFYSVFVMVIPYCMIHYGKPLPETLAAIIAGIALGTLSWKTRSVFLGICIHYSVGLMMDLAALYHRR
jgi:membrane protease YdiL (CAAX protease family)